MKQRDGVTLIADERQRQQRVEGWSDAHDDTHRRGELARAAACYALYGLTVTHKPRWPWARAWWKPASDPVRNLVKAGALIAAELDRVLRAQQRAPINTAEKPASGSTPEAGT